MKTFFLDFFQPTSRGGISVRPADNTRDDAILNGELFAGNQPVGALGEGVLSFGENADPWPPESLQKLKETGQIPGTLSVSNESLKTAFKETLSNV